MKTNLKTNQEADANPVDSFFEDCPLPEEPKENLEPIDEF